MYELVLIGEGNRATVRQLAETSQVPYDYARTIVRDLVVGGLLTSRRGVGGGVMLARSAAQISVLDVFRALKEPASLALCTDVGGACTRSTTCPMHQVFWRDLDDLIEGHLGSADFGSLAETGLRLKAH